MTRLVITMTIIFATWGGVIAFAYLKTGDPLISFFAAQTIAAFVLMAMLPEWTD